MTGRIPEERVREIRERADIVEVVSSYLPLKRSGANHLGLCPFHGEKTPSFNVNAPRQIFHCFGCGVGGDVFSFLMRMEGLSFPEAVRRIGERVGVEVEEEALSPAEETRRREAERLGRINEVACEFYHSLLMEGEEGAPARLFLKKRGYGRESARMFRLGFAPDRWDALATHLAGKGFDPAWAREKLGLIRARPGGSGDYDLFRKRLLFPIQDLRGQVVAFGGRVLDDSLPKYINSPESPVYHKGRVLFGLYQAREGMRQSGEGIVVEGYFDQMALHRAGFKNAVATCGTALTAEHGRLLKRYADRLLLLFDQDSAGQKATFRAMDVLLEEGLPAAVVALDPGDDPDSFLRARGVEAFRERLATARPVLEVFMETVLSAHGESVEGRARAVEEILAKLRLLGSDIERSLYVTALAGKTGLAEDLLRQQLRHAGSKGGSQSASRPQTPENAVAGPARIGLQNERRREKGAGIRAQDLLLRMMIDEASFRQKVAAEGAETLFSDPDRRAIADEILRFAGGEEKPEVSGLNERLREEQKAILSGILIRDGKEFGDDPAGVFEGCRQTAARERLKNRSRELTQLIRQSEKSGDREKLAVYTSEQLEINRKLKSGNFNI
jgi:DNA primase